MSDAASTPSPGGSTIALPVLRTGSGTSGGAIGHGRIRRSRASRWRAIVLIGVHVLMIGHLVKWLLVGGETLSPVEPSESMEFVKQGAVNAGLVFFAIALLSTLVLGRWFCGWGCHVVALQDLCAAMLRRIGIRPKPFRSRLLVYVPFILAMYMFVWPAIYRWGLVPLSQRLAVLPDLHAPPWPGISVELVREDFWSTFPGVLVAIPFLLVCGFACVYFLGAKGFCTYGCPYGGFFAPLDQFSPGRIRVNEDCDQSGHCTAVCSSNVRVHEEVAAYGMVIDAGCMKCMDCVSVCPNNALSYGFGRPAFLVNGPRDGASPPRPRHDLSWPEEIALAGVFLGTFLAVRGIYALIPMLMAAGIAACVSFIAWKAWTVLRRPNASFHRWRLRVHGRRTRAGTVFLAIVAAIAAVVSHSGAMQLLHRRAGIADGQVTIPRQLVFAASPMRLEPSMAASADRAIADYRRLRPIWAGGLALAWWPGVDLRMAWLEACRHDFAEAERLMRRHLEVFGPADAVAVDVMILKALQLKEAEAVDWGLEHLRSHPGSTGVAMQVHRLMEADGRSADCVAALDGILADLGDAPRGVRGDRHADARLGLLRVLSLALVAAGDLERGIEVIETTLRIDASSWGGWLELARARSLAGRGEAVAEAGERAWELRPTAETAASVATSLERVGRIMEASAWRARAAAAAEAAARDQASASTSR